MRILAVGHVNAKPFAHRYVQAWLCLGTCWCCLASAAVPAASPQEADLSIESLEFFEAKIRPILVEACLDCHSTETEASGELLLDSRDGWLAGGSSGAAIVPGDSTASRLMRALSYDDVHLQMPPDGRLPDEVLSDFRQWIDQGANDPRAAQPGSQPKATGLPVERAQEHWAYRPLAEITVPEQVLAPGAATIIDGFIDGRLQQVGLRPNPAVDASVLARRLFYDLSGLPPTPEELQDFLGHPDPDTAYEQLVERLLASPRFGEVMARRWMDVVRYADSITLRGFVLPEAWRYRDYLIEAYNEDRSFAAMIREQVAGDLIECSDFETRRQALTATTFWALGNTNLEQQDKTQLEMDYIDEQMDVLGKAFMGQTLGCARCHDHKFDPIPTKDYYALAGILRSSVGMDHDNVSKWIEQPLPLSSEQANYFEQLSGQRTRIAAEILELKQALGDATGTPSKHLDLATLPGVVVDDSQAKLIGDWTRSDSVGPMVGKNYLHDGNGHKGEMSATFEPVKLAPGEYRVRMSYSAGANRASRVAVKIFSAAGENVVLINQQRPPTEEQLWIDLGTFPFEQDGQAFVLVSNADTDGHVIVDAVQFLPAASAAIATPSQQPDDSAQQQVTLAQREAKLKELDQRLAKRPRYMTIVERHAPADIPVHIRGDVHNLGATVPRGFMTALNHAPSHPQSTEHDRLELAEWLCADENPLTTRVYVNRVWSWLLGQGLVTTLDNFGTTGASPSHPELLDWLAGELVRNQWSTKSLVRKIVHTEAYRRTAVSSGPAMEVDPQNQLLWRGHARRLSAEALRDTMLMASGELDLSVGGSLIPHGRVNDYSFAPTTTRRSVYQPVFRNSLPQLFDAFDFANPSATVGQRPRSTVATQALELMNHPWVIARAETAAERFHERLGQASPEDIMDTLCRTCLARPASSAEIELAAGLRTPETTQEVSRSDMAMLIHAMFASLDFRYLE